ncbi:unnamed protein product, partial [Iphiclides podalirius]
MTGFTALRDVSNAFENDLRQISTELFTAKAGDSFEDILSKKLRDITLFTSKLRLLRAKPLASTPQISEGDKTNVISNYEETAVSAILDQHTVKSFTQTHAVKSLLIASNHSLDSEMRERKIQIQEQLMKYGQLEGQVISLHARLREKELQHASVQAQWHEQLGKLRTIRASAVDTDEEDFDGPLYEKLRKLVEKLELMRWMLLKLVTARTAGYDWLADPHGRLAALKLSRAANSVDSFLWE